MQERTNRVIIGKSDTLARASRVGYYYGAEHSRNRPGGPVSLTEGRYRKELARRQAKEISFCELPEIVVEKLIVWDDYESEYTTFDVCGTEIRVLDEELAEALKQLPEQSRNIVLMFFFLDMSDSEIGEKLNINRSTSYRHRRNSLEEIRKQLKEKKQDEE